jgi:hypothetical protein
MQNGLGAPDPLGAPGVHSVHASMTRESPASSGFAELLPQALALISIGAPLFVLAARIFGGTNR